MAYLCWLQGNKYIKDSFILAMVDRIMEDLLLDGKLLIHWRCLNMLGNNLFNAGKKIEKKVVQLIFF